jgi:hypothetical protein
MIFDETPIDNSSNGNTDINITKDNVIDVGVKKVDKLPKLLLSYPLKEPFKVIKGFTGRINGKLYEFIPGNDFDGSLIPHRKLETLINTRYLKKV